MSARARLLCSRTTLLCVCTILLCACTKARTETVIVVDTNGVRIPQDVAKLHFTVADRQSGGSDDIVFDADVVMCHDTLMTSCYNVPVSAALFPGKMRPQDSVRVEVDAVNPNGAVVTADAALFTFAEGQSERLDFVLWANCIGVTDCAVRNQACGPDGMCTMLSPTPFHGATDLATHVVRDMASCGTLNQACCTTASWHGPAWPNPSVTPDSGTGGGPDLMPPIIDMAQPIIDMAMGGGGAGGGGGGGAGGGGGGGGGGSQGGTCMPGLRCVGNVCVP